MKESHITTYLHLRKGLNGSRAKQQGDTLLGKFYPCTQISED